MTETEQKDAVGRIRWIRTGLLIAGLLVAVVWFIGSAGNDSASDNDINQQADTPFMTEADISDDDVVIEVTEQGFSPAEVEIAFGQRVMWINRSERFVWPASDLHPTHEEYAEFDPREPVAPGEVFGFVFERAGAWDYHDHLAPLRVGTVIVHDE